MALTGNTVQSTYLDLVQLEKSGAGLPAHAGKEAAVYDGSGAQILGRTAVRHWLDPHPDAASFDETWEFSTKGTMTQAALETAGWTFEDCTAEVANGLLILTASGSGMVRAWLSVSFAGDFDVVITPGHMLDYIPNTQSTTAYRTAGGGGVADYRESVANVVHYGIAYVNQVAVSSFDRRIDATWASLAGTSELDAIYSANQVVRVYRYSSTVEITSGSFGSFAAFKLLADDGAPNNNGFAASAPVTDASTFNKLFLTGSVSGVNAGEKFTFASVRRFQ